METAPRRVFVVGAEDAAVKAAASQVAQRFAVTWCPTVRWARALGHLIRGGAAALVAEYVMGQDFTLLYGAPWDEPACRAALRTACPDALWVSTDAHAGDDLLSMEQLLALPPPLAPPLRPVDDPAPPALPCTCVAIAVCEPAVTWVTEVLHDAYRSLDAFVCASTAGRPVVLRLDGAALAAAAMASIASECVRGRSIAFLVEPPALIADVHTGLTHRRECARAYGAGVCIPGQVQAGMHAGVVGGVPFGTSWVTAEEAKRALATPKRPVASLIVSPKQFLPGHRLRHEVVAWARAAGRAADGAADGATDGAADVCLFGKQSTPLERKADGHARFMYSIVIENSCSPGYWTEKLVDCVACGSVALYCGAPDIGRWFDCGSVLAWSTLPELHALLDGMSDADYAARTAAVTANATRARVFRSGLSLLFLHSRVPSLPNVQVVGGQAVGCVACDPPPPPPLHFVVFGAGRFEAASRRLEASAVEAGVFASVYRFGHEDLLTWPDFAAAAATFPGTRGWGFWAWKSRVVLEALQRVPEGDLLLYCDAGCHLTLPARLRWFVDRIGPDADVLTMRMPHVARTWAKGDLLAHFGLTTESPEATAGQAVGGIHVWRAGPRALAAVREWTAVCAHRHLIDDTPSVVPNHASFRDHRHDQAALDLVLKTRAARGDLTLVLLGDETWQAGADTVIFAARDTSGPRR
jgi:hypothetical protein